MSLANNLTTTDRLKELLPQLFSEQQRQGDYYLRFQLTDEINALLNLNYVRESTTIDSTQITAVPNLPGYVLGLMSSRNEVFMALDLAHLVGLSPQTLNQRQYQTIIVQTNSSKERYQSDENTPYGMAVKRILGISRILPQQFASSTVDAPEILSPFVQGSIQENQDGSSELQYSFLIDLARLVALKMQS